MSRSSSQSDSTKPKRVVGEKRLVRSVRWELNVPLVTRTVGVIILVAATLTGLYLYQSGRLDESILEKAKLAEAGGDPEGQIRWLQQYELLHPNEPDVIVALARAADFAANQKPENRSDRVERARRLLSEAVAVLDQSDDADLTSIAEELRRRLILRELQFGYRFAGDAERQIVRLNADQDDAIMLRSMALALSWLRLTETEGKRDPEKYRRGQQYWLWLSQQSLVEALTTAWRANPDDLDVAARLVNLCKTSPESFSESSANDATLVGEEVASHLRTMADNGRARFILIARESETDPEVANQLLEQSADASLARLADHFASLSDDPSGLDNEKKTRRPILPPAEPDSCYTPEWDYELVLRAVSSTLQSESLLDGDRIVASERLDELIRFADLAVPASSVERAYILRGQQFWDDDKPQKAWELWERGIEQLGSLGLDIQLLTASTLVEKGDRNKAAEYLNRINELIGTAKASLSGPMSQTLTRAELSKRRRKLDQATWSTQFLAGQLALRKGEVRRAGLLLSRVLDSQLPAGDEQRLAAAVALADANRRSGEFDLAATAYERAAALAIDPDQYRVLAAEAWTRSGNANRAFQQWRAVKGASMPLRVAQARALVSEELAKAPATRNFGECQKLIDNLRGAVARIPDSNAAERSLLQADLELLALAIPDRDDGRERAASVDRLEQISKKYPENSRLQLVATLSLASNGQKDKAREALQRLEKIEGKDSWLYAQTAAKILVLNDERENAINTLSSYAAENPANASKALGQAADVAVADGKTDRAYRLLQRVPEEQRSAELLFRIFSLALNLDASDQRGTAEADEQNVAKWETAIRDQEGDNGSWWRLAKASRLLGEFDRLGENDPKRSEYIESATELHSQIRIARPRWGLGHSLNGRIALRRGLVDDAINSFKQGIANGDRRLETAVLLSKLLLQSNRIAEAEAEFSRFERLANSYSEISAFAIAIAEKKGDYSEGLSLARRNASNLPNDVASWLLLGQTAAMAARASDDTSAKDKLVAESKRALDKALELSENESLAAYKLLVRFQATFFGLDAAKNSLREAFESNIPEPAKSLFVGLGFVELKDAASALPVLERAMRIAPKDADVYLAMATYHQLVRANANQVAMLEQAYKLDPNRVDIRNRLAIAIALRDGAEVPWDRLNNLLDSDLLQSSPNKLLHSLILMNRGDSSRQEQAARILSGMISSRDPNRDDATRLLAALKRRWWSIEYSKNPDSAEARRLLAETRNLYKTLTNKPSPQALDLYRSGDLLLKAEQIGEVEELSRRLGAMTKGSAIALDLRLRLARQLGQDEKASELAKQWAQRAVTAGGIDPSRVWETAGRALSKLGFHQEALDWLERAYSEDPSNLRGYVVGLARGQQFSRAIEVCKQDFLKIKNPESVALIADVLILSGKPNEVSEAVEDLFRDTLQEFAENPRLLESIATLRLAQHRYPEAIAFYEQAEKLAPSSVRVLNNLAMALSEIPGRVDEAMPKIQKAINLYGRSPELLDTQGLAMLRAGRVEESIEVLREATESSEDPRYRFHLLVALLRKGDEMESIAQWAQIDLKSLKQSALTPAERRDLETMQKQFNRQRES